MPNLDVPAAEALGESISDTVDSLAKFHLQHDRQASRIQVVIDWMTERLGRPAVALMLLLMLSGWGISAGLLTGGRVDRPAFAWLELAATLIALVMAVFILVTQRREDQLEARRAKLTLELALLSDRKSSKIIALLEELRKDHPGVVDRIDDETDDLSVPADPQLVLAAIDERTSASPER